MMPSLPLRSSPGEFVYDALLSEQARVPVSLYMMPSLPLRSSPGEFVDDALLSEQARVAVTSRHGGDDCAWCRHLRHLVIHSGDGGPSAQR